MSEEKEHMEFMEEPEPSSFKLIFSLGIAGFFSGLLLVSAYIYTEPLIEANKAEALQEAIFKVLPGAINFTALELKGDQLIPSSEDNESEEEKETTEPSQIFAGFNQAGELVGFAIPGSEPGFQDIIEAICGYNANRKIIIGFEVLESRETPGLGDKIFKDMDFKANFAELSVEPEILGVKKGEKKKPNEVETITGATISSKAVIRLLNNSLSEWKDVIDTYINEGQINTTASQEAQ